eukprot:SAG22_NODE_372_length_11551_cov_20.656741_12_plen_372_part_00
MPSPDGTAKAKAGGAAAAAAAGGSPEGGAKAAGLAPEDLEAAVAELLAADPGLGVKKLVVALRQAHPEWAGGAKEVRQAKAALDAAASSAEPAAEEPAAAGRPAAADQQLVAAAGAAAAKGPGRSAAAAAAAAVEEAAFGPADGGGGAAEAVQGQRRPEQTAESTTPRQKAMLAKRDAMTAKQTANTLSMQDIVDYETYIQGLVKVTMEGEKQQLERSFKMAEAKLRMARDSRRQRALNDEFEKVRRRGMIFNEDVLAINVSSKALSFCCASTVFLSKTVPFHVVPLSQAEVERFHASAAFEQARESCMRHCLSVVLALPFYLRRWLSVRFNRLQATTSARTSTGSATAGSGRPTSSARTTRSTSRCCCSR